MSFQVSDKVVCVDDSNQDDDLGRVVKGAVYVIREIVFDGPEMAFRLTGIVLEHTAVRNFGERAFKARRFRKLTEVQEENRAKAHRRGVLSEFQKQWLRAWEDGQ